MHNSRRASQAAVSRTPTDSEPLKEEQCSVRHLFLTVNIANVSIECCSTCVGTTSPALAKIVTCPYRYVFAQTVQQA
jgi:hypothetical protein